MINRTKNFTFFLSKGERIDREGWPNFSGARNGGASGASMRRYELVVFSSKTVAHWPSPDLLEGRALIPGLNEAVRNRMCLLSRPFSCTCPNPLESDTHRFPLYVRSTSNFASWSRGFSFFSSRATYLFYSSDFLVVIIILFLGEEFPFYFFDSIETEKSLKYPINTKWNILNEF